MDIFGRTVAQDAACVHPAMSTHAYWGTVHYIKCEKCGALNRRGWCAEWRLQVLTWAVKLSTSLHDNASCSNQSCSSKKQGNSLQWRRINIDCRRASWYVNIKHLKHQYGNKCTAGCITILMRNCFGDKTCTHTSVYVGWSHESSFQSLRSWLLAKLFAERRMKGLPF